MFLTSAIFFAVSATSYFGQELDDDELALAEQTTVIEQDDEAEDGELIFDSDDIASELETRVNSSKVQSDCSHHLI